MRWIPPLLALILCILPGGRVHANDGPNVVGTVPEVPPGKRLYQFLEGQAKLHFDARRQEIAQLNSPEAVNKRASVLREKFNRALGELPAVRTPLKAQVVGREQRDGYSVERVIYESQPGHHVTANVYIPEGKPPFPGVLVPCGHSANGKAAEPYQRISILLALNGMVSMCYDPIGQGERVQILDANGKQAVSGSTTEHTLAGIGAWLVGRSVAGHRLWDGVRSLDYLASRDDVDPKRLGCTGNSGGGTLTSYLMAYDDRILAAAPSCYVTSLERLFATIGPQDAEQNITGQVALGIEHADYVNMRAPKPTLLCVGTKDFFDIDGSWTTFREVKNIYGILGHADRVDIFESNETHGFTGPRRQASMRWMRRWLLGKDDSPFEQDFAVAPDAAIQCTKSGQVVREFKEVTVFDMNAKRAHALDEVRKTSHAGRSVADLREAVRRRLALPQPQSIQVDRRRETDQRDGYEIKEYMGTIEPGMTIPVLLFRPVPHAAPKGLMTIYVGADPKIAGPGGEVEARVKKGEWVAMVDPRGMGETAPVPPPGGGYGRGLFGSDEREAALALHLNRPLLGQRVYDVLQAFRMVRPVEGFTGFRLIGSGMAGPIVLHAAALSDDVKAVELESSIVSWSDVVQTPISRGQLSSVVPGVLEDYDLPDLAAALAPRASITIRKPVGPAGKLLSPEQAVKFYADVKEQFAAQSAQDRFSLDATP